MLCAISISLRRSRSRRTRQESAGARALSRKVVPRVDQQAALEGQAATTDARRQIVSKPDELLDLEIKSLLPECRQPCPIRLSGGALVREILECCLDRRQRNTDTLRGTDERKPAKGVTGIATLVAVVARARDESFTLIEVERGHAHTAALCDLADGPLMERRLRAGHAPTLSLDLNHG